MAKDVNLSRDQAEGLADAVAAFLKTPEGNSRTGYFASQGALDIAQAFGMSEEYQERLSYPQETE